MNVESDEKEEYPVKLCLYYCNSLIHKWELKSLNRNGDFNELDYFINTVNDFLGKIWM